MIYLVATLEIKDGSLTELLKLASPCIAATRNESGCISYDLLHSTTNESELVFVERWKDQAAIDAHFIEPHLIAWRDAAKPYVVNQKIEIIHPDHVDER